MTSPDQSRALAAKVRRLYVDRAVGDLLTFVAFSLLAVHHLVVDDPALLVVLAQVALVTYAIYGAAWSVRQWKRGRS